MTTWPTCPALPVRPPYGAPSSTSPPPMPVETTMPNMNEAPPAGAVTVLPNAMHMPSPPSRTGTPGTATATRSTIGKSRHAGMLTGPIAPVVRWIDPPTRCPRRGPAPSDRVRDGLLGGAPDLIGIVDVRGSPSGLTKQPPGFVDDAGGDLGAADVDGKYGGPSVPMNSVSMDVVGLAGSPGCS